jgi:hypothetical protein
MGWVALAAAVPALVLTVLAIVRVRNGFGSIDLSIWDQALWRASQGRPGVSTISGESLLADHFAPGVLVFVGLYRLIASPVWMFAAQGIATWAAVLILVNRLRHTTWRRRAVVAVVLTLTPPVAFGILGDPHSTTLALPFGLAGLFAVEDDRPGRACLLGLLAGLFRLEVALGVLAAFIFLPRGSCRRWPAAVPLLLYCGIALHLEQALGGPGQWASHYGYLGASAGAVLTHPYRMIAGLFSVDALHSAAFWLVGGGFIGLARPRWALCGLAVGLPVLLSHWAGSHQWGLQYDIGPTLFLVAAGIRALDNERMQTRLVMAVAVLSLVAGPAAPIPIATPPITSIAHIGTPVRQLLCLTAGLPTSAGVAASPTAVAPISHRDVLYAWPWPFYDPAESGPWVYVTPAEPALQPSVDFIIKVTSDATPVPAGYVLDAASPAYERYRKASLPPSPPSDCEPVR